MPDAWQRDRRFPGCYDDIPAVADGRSPHSPACCDFDMICPRRCTVLLTSIYLLFVAPCPADDWPGWRGPTRDDVSRETGLLKEWPEQGPRKLWTSKQAGVGYSSIAVVGETLFTLGADDSNDQLLAISTADGSRRWSVPIGKRWKNKWGDGPRSTPSVAGDRVVALGGRGDLICASAATGDILWSSNLREIGGRIPNWGYSESPLIDAGRVVVTPGHDDGTMAAFDLTSGELMWQSSEIRQPAHYSSIIVAEHNGQRQYIQLGPEALFAVNADDGSLLWQTEWPGEVAVVPTPLFHAGSVYVSAGYGVGSMLVDVAADNEVRVRYRNKIMKNQHGGVIRIGDHVYGYSDGRGWVCQTLATGEMVWNEKRRLGKGAIACADEMLYCLEQKSGTCVLIRATPEGWEEHGRVTIEPQTDQRSSRGGIWSHPVIANGCLYLRDQEIICCYDISSSQQTAVQAANTPR